MNLGQWIIIDHRTLPCSSQKDFCKNLLMQVRICSYETWQHMWARTHKSGWYIKCQRIICYCRPQFFVGSYRWCCSAGCPYCSFCASSHEVMTNVYKALKKVKSIPYVATGPLANVFLTVWGMWKFYHCASEECTIWISEALMGISYWAAVFGFVSLIDSDLISYWYVPNVMLIWSGLAPFLLQTRL